MQGGADGTQRIAQLVRQHRQELVFRPVVALGAVAFASGLEKFTEIRDDQVQAAFTGRASRGQRETHIEVDRAGARQGAAAAAAAGQEKTLELALVGLAYEPIERTANDRLDGFVHHRREARVGVEDVAATTENDGAFLHLFHEVAVRLIGAVQRIDLASAGAFDDKGIDLARANGP